MTKKNRHISLMCTGIYKWEVLNLLLVVVDLVFLIVNVAIFMYCSFVVVNVFVLVCFCCMLLLLLYLL